MITGILIGVLIIFLFTAVFAPLESLGWWAGWYGEEIAGNPVVDATTETTHSADDADNLQLRQTNLPKHFIVYLSGIGAITGSSILPEELPFLDALRERVSDAVVINDVFPYAVTNVGLTGERAFAWLFRKIEALRDKNPLTLGMSLVLARNMFQVLVSADPRYGPIYNLGIAKEIWESLQRHGYQHGCGAQVTLIGVSGGGQISVGAVTYLAAIVDAPIDVISLGGVISSDDGLLKMKHLYHLHGTKDYVHMLGPVTFPGRWPIFVNSAWNRAKAQGKITMKATSSADHVNKNSHFDQNALMPDGRSYFDVTLDEVVAILAPSDPQRSAD